MGNSHEFRFDFIQRLSRHAENEIIRQKLHLMSTQIFLSTVTSEFGSLRQRLAGLLQRTKRVHVRHQDDFIHRGVKTLRMLEEEVAASEMIVHVIGKEPGWCPPVDQVEDFLDRHPAFAARFPELVDSAKAGTISATQWEVWLALFFKIKLRKDMRVLIFEFPDRLQPSSSQQQHSKRLHESHHHPTTVTRDEALYDEIILSLLGLGYLTEQDIHRPCHLPYSTLGELFIGRDGFLEDLRQKFLFARDAGRWPNQVVRGVGGLGKTQMAVEYALRNRDEYSAVLMVNADTPESLRSGLAGLAGVLHSHLDPTMPDDAKEKATLLWLQKHPGWLLIVDNADTEAARNEVTKRLAQWTDGHVLITARYHQWPKSVEALDLHVLQPDDAAAFLLRATDGKRVATSDDPQQARLLASDDLDGLCLALEQAAAYIEDRQISFAEYRRRWAQNQKEARTWADKEVMQYHIEQEVSLSVATTWLTTFRELTPAAQSLLQMLAWLSPEPIPRALLQHPETETEFQSLQPGEDIETALAALRRYSLLSHRLGDPADSAGRIHRVVQLITRERLPEEEQQTSLMAMLQAMNANVVGHPADVRTWPIMEPLLPHLTVMMDHAESLQIDEPTSRLLSDIGTLLWAKARYEEAESFQRRALATDERHFGPDSIQVAIQLNNLAQTCHTRNRLAEAELLMRRGLAIEEKSKGVDHPHVAIQLNNLALLFHATNRLAEAEPMMRRTLAIDEKFYGAEHPQVANRLSNLAALLQDTNRLTEAEPMMRRALVINEQSYGAKHPIVAISLNVLGRLLYFTNRRDEAELLWCRALAIDEQSYGPEHPKVAIRLNNLASLLKDTNRLEEAEPMIRRALAIDERSYGAEHPNVARGFNNLATLLWATNRLAEAELLIRRALAIDEQSYGAEHPDVAIDLNNLARLLQDMSRLTEAEPLARRAVEISEKSLVEQHPNTIAFRKVHASILSEMED
jgi:tetratricopeptide (TPR) repeat protein